MSDTDPIVATVKLIASLVRRDTYGVRRPPVDSFTAPPCQAAGAR